MSTHYVLAIDQGTSSTRALIVNQTGKLISQHQCELPQSFPRDGWVEHDPEQIWQDVCTCCQHALAKSQLAATDISTIGITNQRETTVVWDKTTHQAIYPAIVWQDRRSAALCEQLIAAGHQTMVQDKTGLLLDPYFSASKIAWILENVNNARQLAAQNKLAFGTIDSFLLWRLTGGKVHATDASNASRTLLFNITTQSWDQDLLDLFNIPETLLPTVYDNCAQFGTTTTDWLGAAIPITGMAGDQQAATVGQACFQPGMLKITYGTGCFLLANTGNTMIKSRNRLLSTVAYRINNTVTYGLEGSIFVAGAAMQWLRDALQLIGHASDSEQLASTLTENHGVYLVPAFTGMGAPYWDPKARGAILGLTRDSGVAHIVRAALEAVCYQTRDLLTAMGHDSVTDIACLRVDGGMVANDWLMQFLADIVQCPVERSSRLEASAQGVAFLAGLGVGLYDSLNDIANYWQCQTQFSPKMSAKQSQYYYDGWQAAVARVCD